MTREMEESIHPAPARARVTTRESMFAVWGGVIAWFLQLNVVYAFASTPCFESNERTVAQAPAHVLPLVVGAVSLLIALAATWMGVVLLRRTQRETGGDEQHLLETGHGRTRYLAIWGIAFSGVFSLLIAINLVVQIGYQTCSG